MNTTIETATPERYPSVAVTMPERNQLIVKFVEGWDIQRELARVLVLGWKNDNWSRQSRYAPLVRKKLEHLHGYLLDAINVLNALVPGAEGGHIFLGHILRGAEYERREENRP